MFYDRKIKYLDYYENGTKVSGGGFAKLEVRDNTLRLELTVRGLHPTDSFDREIVLQGAEKEEILGQVHIQNGSGQYRCSCDADRGIGGTGISYGELRGIRISIGGTREILCQWGNTSSQRRIAQPEKDRQTAEAGWQGLGEVPMEAPEKMPWEESKTESQNMSVEELEETPKAESVETHKGLSGAWYGKALKEEPTEDLTMVLKEEPTEDPAEAFKEEPMEIFPEASEGESAGNLTKAPEQRVRTKGLTDDQASPIRQVITVSGQSDKGKSKKIGFEDAKKNSAGEQPADQKIQVMLLEDKWQQLSALYPHIQPFHDDRDYLSLTPSDFVLFPTRFYRAVNNSFLLHGYYNYHHLILARIERRGEVCYYIGVPGNYFEREKQVAIMFGFESFECEAEPAKTGDFGYYMMRTEL